jgi:NAD(P)-dependent dehydrogenase (short-subunit alcohol dehydrogenase family)
MAWNVTDIPNLSGKVAVVTGANGGLGFESAKALAGAGAHVVMAARNLDKARRAHDEILGSQTEASLDIVELDLGSLDSVRDAAQMISDKYAKIDILINNAGLMALPERRTADGFEMQFGVNHLGHWVFTNGLLKSLLAADAARVVTVTSTAHHTGQAVDPDNPNLEGNYGPWKAYGQSKLANFHFALGLQEEFEKRSLAAQSLVAHPGLSHTNLQVHTVDQGGGGWSAGLWKWMAANTGMDADRGVLPQLRAATDPEAKGGEFYAPRYGNSGVPVRRPVLRRMGLQKAIDNLWVVSEKMTGTKLDFDSAMENV